MDSLVEFLTYPSITNNKILSIMRTVFNLTFGVIKFTFKAIFWFIGIIFMLVLGSCPD